MRRTWLLPAALACGCASDPDAGTAIGNPGYAQLRLAETDRVAIAGGSSRLDAVRLRTCDGGWTETDGPGAFAPADGVELALPEGTWCAVELVLGHPIAFDARVDAAELNGDGEQAVGLSLAVPTIAVEAPAGEPLAIGGQELVFELGEPGWLSVEDFELVGEAVVAPVDLAEQLQGELEESSSLFADDGDGRVSDDERDDARLAWSGASEDDDEGTTVSLDCEDGAVLGLLILAPLGLRRRD